MIKEIWKDIELGSCIYSISNYGKVYNNTRNREQSTFLSGRGYFSFSTQKNKIKKNYLVHRLVALLFIPNPLNKETINHINGNKQDNFVANLEWASYSENNYHAIKTGLRTYKDRMKKVAQIKDGTIINVFESVAEASKKTNINKSSIYDCAKGKTKSGYGFVWKYI